MDYPFQETLSEQDRVAEMTSDITEFDDKLVRKYLGCGE